MARTGPDPVVPAAPGDDLESTTTLLALVRDGNPEARERLVRRYRPALLRWAHGRLPGNARDLAETQDLVQVTLLKALDHVSGFVPRREGAFLAYLRTILVNEIRMEIRKVSRRPVRQPLPDEVPGRGASPLDHTIDAEILEAYATALATLREEEREGVILRLAFGYPHQQVAEALGKPSPDAARMLVTRATAKLTEVLDVHPRR